MADQKVSDLPSLNGADVDAADLLYIVDSSAGSAGSKKITVGQYQLAPVSGGTANGVMYLDGSKVVTTGSALVFDGTNLGVGASSPSARLHVVGNQFRQNDATGSQGYVINTTSATTTLATLFGGSSFAIQTGNSGTDQLLLDASGNLGLGVTPSANAYGSAKTFFVSGDSANGLLALSEESISATSQYVSLMNNAYPDGASVYKYKKSSQVATSYRQNDGAHSWFTAPSGTAGTAITFTQAMTLDASGNLLVNRTAVVGSEKLSVNGGSRVETFADIIGGAGTPELRLYQNTNNWSVRNSGGALAFYDLTGSAERARITSVGDLLVGTTTASGVGNSIFGSSVPGVIHQNNNAAANGFVFTSYRRSSVEIGSVSQNGTTAVLFNTTSDRRLKQNIVPAPSASNVIDAIEIVSHDWKAAPDEHVTYGVIAQDLALVAPQAVLQGDDGDEIEKTWGVDYSKLVPMLIKEIQTLRARVAALESA